MKLRHSFGVSIVLAAIGCAAPSGNGGVDMERDEQAIRRYFDSWILATTKGDLGLARSLIADDAVFLVPGTGPMDKEGFAAAATASDPNTDFALECSIDEIKVFDDHAWLRTKMSLVMTDRASGTRTKMAGHELSILKRHGDTWVVIRDANTMVPVPE